MRKRLALILTLLLTTCSLLAQVTISGDARVRPRLDVKDAGQYGLKTSDIYYLYRARLNISADIGDGYYFKTRLGHNWIAYWLGFFGTGTTPHAASLPSAGRGSVDFMELYFGHTGEKMGWSAGLIPVTGSPLTDIHFYPYIMVDIPWLILNNEAAHGFNLYYKLAGKNLDATILVDDNAGKKVVDEFFVAVNDTNYSYYIDQTDGTIKRDTVLTTSTAADSQTKDQYTLDIKYPLSLAGMKFTPEILYTIADEGHAAPMTYGAEFGLPRLAGFNLSAFAGLTSQTVADTLTGLEAYTGWISRVKLVGKLGPGTLVAWYDKAATTADIEGALTQNHSYLWLSYSYTVHKSEQGALTLAPTYRLVTQKIEGVKDYSRAMIELTTQITFK